MLPTYARVLSSNPPDECAPVFPQITKASHGFAVQKISDGVYAVIRKEPPGLTVNGNSVLIINEADVIILILR